LRPLSDAASAAGKIETRCIYLLVCLCRKTRNSFSLFRITALALQSGNGFPLSNASTPYPSNSVGLDFH